VSIRKVVNTQEFICFYPLVIDLAWQSHCQVADFGLYNVFFMRDARQFVYLMAASDNKMAGQ